MFRALAIAALLVPTVAAAVGSAVPTDLLVRVGSDLQYYGTCSITINRLEPGDADASVLNVTSCGTLTYQSTSAPPWTIVRNVTYGDVYLPDQHLVRCGLIHSQLIVTGMTARQNITIECADAPTLLVDGFDLGNNTAR